MTNLTKNQLLQLKKRYIREGYKLGLKEAKYDATDILTATSDPRFSKDEFPKHRERMKGVFIDNIASQFGHLAAKENKLKQELRKLKDDELAQLSKTTSKLFRKICPEKTL